MSQNFVAPTSITDQAYYITRWDDKSKFMEVSLMTGIRLSVVKRGFGPQRTKVKNTNKHIQARYSLPLLLPKILVLAEKLVSR